MSFLFSIILFLFSLNLYFSANLKQSSNDCYALNYDFNSFFSTNLRSKCQKKNLNLNQFKNLTTVNDFFEYFGYQNPDQVIFLRKATNSEYAVHADCQLEKKTIYLDSANKEHPSNSNDPETLLFPSCIRVNRCSGCCDISHKSTCIPSSKITKKIKRAAIRLKRSSTGTVPEAGFKITEVEEHQGCKCECKVKQPDCNSLQEYQPELCKCICTNTDQEFHCANTNNKIWDANECKCKCMKSKLCSTGFFFSHETCSCLHS